MGDAEVRERENALSLERSNGLCSPIEMVVHINSMGHMLSMLFSAAAVSAVSFEIGPALYLSRPIENLVDMMWNGSSFWPIELSDSDTDRHRVSGVNMSTKSTSTSMTVIKWPK